MTALPFLGHEEEFQLLQKLLGQGRLPHALLITGPEGIGKARFAAHLAKTLLCASTAAPCGACGPCRLIEEEKHPDLLKLMAENNRIKIDAIRELIQNFNFSPLMGTRRVALLPEAHLLNAAAANALLKTLEEPPAGTFFILVTHAPGWIPRTILSRCQIVRLKPLSDGIMGEILEKAQVQVTPGLLKEAMGSAGRALRLATVRGEVPALDHLLDPQNPLPASQAFQLAQGILDEEKLESFLEALLGEIHARLTSSPPSTEFRFDLLVFTDKILEMRRRLRVNINPKLALSRLLLFFREPLETRLES